MWFCYRDAPALSTATDGGEALPLSSENLLDSRAVGGSHAAVGGDAGDPSGSEWDDEALAADTTTRGPAASNTASSMPGVGSLKLSDTNTHHNSYIDPDNIAEKLRVEETKAALAAAREGMEREAQKVAQEKERKLQEAADRQQNNTAGGGGATGGRWVPAHLRGSAGVSLRARMAGAGSQALNVADEELFPDLASADKMLADKEAAEKKRVSAANKPISAVSGATWGNQMAAKTKEREAAKKTVIPATTQTVEPAPPEPVKEAASEVTPVEAEKEAQTPATTLTPEAAKPVATKKKLEKKKKLSTFKVGGTS